VADDVPGPVVTKRDLMDAFKAGVGRVLAELAPLRVPAQSVGDRLAAGVA